MNIPLRMVGIFLTASLLTLGACKSTPPSKLVKINADGSQTIEVDDTSESYRYAYYLVPLVVDQNEANSLATRAQTPEFKAEFRKHVVNGASKESKAQIACLFDRGAFEKLIPVIIENNSMANLQPQLAGLWAHQYELNDLKSFYQSLQSPAMKKFIALSKQGLIRKESSMDDIKSLHQQGVLSENEIKSFVVIMTDTKFTAFMDQVLPSFKQISQLQLHKNQDAMLKKFASDVAMDAVNCAGQKGVGI